MSSELTYWIALKGTNYLTYIKCKYNNLSWAPSIHVCLFLCPLPVQDLPRFLEMSGQQYLGRNFSSLISKQPQWSYISPDIDVNDKNICKQQGLNHELFNIIFNDTLWQRFRVFFCCCFLTFFDRDDFGFSDVFNGGESKLASFFWCFEYTALIKFPFIM